MGLLHWLWVPRRGRQSGFLVSSESIYNLDILVRRGKHRRNCVSRVVKTSCKKSGYFASGEEKKNNYEDFYIVSDDLKAKLTVRDCLTFVLNCLTAASLHVQDWRTKKKKRRTKRDEVSKMSGREMRQWHSHSISVMAWSDINEHTGRLGRSQPVKENTKLLMHCDWRKKKNRKTDWGKLIASREEKTNNSTGHPINSLYVIQAGKPATPKKVGKSCSSRLRERHWHYVGPTQL